MLSARWRTPPRVRARDDTGSISRGSSYGYSAGFGIAKAATRQEASARLDAAGAMHVRRVVESWQVPKSGAHHTKNTKRMSRQTQANVGHRVPTHRGGQVQNRSRRRELCRGKKRTRLQAEQPLYEWTEEVCQRRRARGLHWHTGATLQLCVRPQPQPQPKPHVKAGHRAQPRQLLTAWQMVSK